MTVSQHQAALTQDKPNLSLQVTTVDQQTVDRPRPDEATILPQLPGYEILEKLGRGGMGIVYKARQTQLRRLVALKMILHGEHADEQHKQRFRREAEAVARLGHANIVQIYEIGEHQGQPYFALEYCEGGTLRDQLRDGPLAAAAAGQMVETLARAVEAAHQQRIVHRDLKPGNVLLTADGTVKVADFGLARELAGETAATQAEALTASGALVGTPSYMAPEQARGEQAGPAADVYALGVILYEMLTGRPPFRAANVLDTLQQVKDVEPVPVRRLQPRTPRDLETICLKCLHKEPGRRYGSAVALAEDLHRFGAGEPIQARPVGRGERAWKWARRRPGVAAMTVGLVGAVLLLVVGGTGAAIWYIRDQAGQEIEALQRRPEFKEVLSRKQLREGLAGIEVNEDIAFAEDVKAALQGKTGDTEELLDLAERCRLNPKRYSEAAQLYLLAFNADPQLAADLAKGLRFQAATAAVLAAAGKGAQDQRLADKDKIRWRQQALGWLQADVAARTQLVEAAADPLGTWHTTQQLALWQQHPDLASVRPDQDFALLPAQEQKAWRQLWSTVADLLARARASFKTTKLQSTLEAKQGEQKHEVNFAAGKAYIIDLTSTAFDTDLRLEDSQGKVLQENDHLDARDTNSRILFTAVRDGLYRIVATAYKGRGAGAYTLTIREFAGKQP